MLVQPLSLPHAPLTDLTASVVKLSQSLCQNLFIDKISIKEVIDNNTKNMLYFRHFIKSIKL